MNLNNINNSIVVDVETSGVNPFVHDVLAIALLPINEAISSTVIHVRQSGIKWTPFAKRNFENFREEWSKSALSHKDAYASIEKYIAKNFKKSNPTLIGHNIGFDLAFLRKLAFQAGKEDITCFSHRTIDTHTLLHLLFLMGKVPGTALSSDGAFEYFDVAPLEVNRHTAMGDALATRSLYLRLLEYFR